MKKKILVITAIVCLLAITISTASLAYFTDKHTVENVFSVGDVTITLDESKVTLDGNKHAVVGEERTAAASQDYGNLYPGQSIKKDPTVTNTGSEKAYVAAKVTISATNGFTDANKDYARNLLSGGLLSDNTTVATVVNSIEDNAVVIYILYHKEMAKGEKVVLFDTLSISAAYDNPQMNVLSGLKIRVDAYAVQSVGFDDAQEAITKAFSTEFEALAPSTNP